MTMTRAATTKRLNFAPKFISGLLLLLLLLLDGIQTEQIDANDEEVDRFCYPAKYKNTRLSCECSNVSAAPWGMRALHIDCSYKDFKAEDLTGLLPLYIDTLDLSWNALDRAPVFTSDSLRLLNLMHNNISSIAANNFGSLTSLRELYLSWNSIQQLDAQAFQSLPHLTVLSLEHNNLHTLPSQIFSPLLVLATLELSWNRQLNQSIGQDVYTTFGINQKLQKLQLDACNLQELQLPRTAPLIELSLRRNQFERVPSQLPASLHSLDISENRLQHLQPEDTRHLSQIRQLFVEDMPQLRSIDAHSLASLHAVESMSFQNTRSLNYIDGDAFVSESGNQTLPPLKSIIFRGTLVRSFNASLSPVFSKLTELDLNGVPLHCDCKLEWLKNLDIQTNGRCLLPARVRGMLISSVRRDEFSCEKWPRWIYGIIILGLIALCAAGVYLIVMGLRPHRGVTMRRKVGAGSPYARVTIEPNRQENVH
ncbi:leucine-rich repeat and immunoglobulin-like domain-containing nogo receptor-interacting protein 3 [Drosophila albomicans]|uniref:Leucine-rich repeat and immunoglobulin-like domain-containing nogo receptor-interacting protein 3 n=1 Tax=Drosophila albomicans TaxID=7291 RepID=A0A6P8WXS1_DROAB|nr:leucine-rich repeat and immunoglobulin-like domain-containing nogo receptor-interacting protein 3 [Drosophila albomicans]